MKKWYNYPKFLGSEKCRFCGHSSYGHMEVKDFGEERMQSKWDKCGQAQLDHYFQPNACDCPGFAPVDNLEYLEMKANEKKC